MSTSSDIRVAARYGISQGSLLFSIKVHIDRLAMCPANCSAQMSHYMQKYEVRLMHATLLGQVDNFMFTPKHAHAAPLPGPDSITTERV